jgi:threonyl-tRNA synthetase
VQVRVDDKQVEVQPGQPCRDALSQALSGKRIKRAVACACNGTLVDLSAPVPVQCDALTAVDADSPEGLSVLRHSTAHIMAEAVKKLFPLAKVTIGPDIENGFYYDFDFERPFTPEDLEAIEREMAATIQRNEPFNSRRLSKQEAKKIFLELNEPYKIEILDELVRRDGLHLYPWDLYRSLPRTSCPQYRAHQGLQTHLGSRSLLAR